MAEKVSVLLAVPVGEDTALIENTRNSTPFAYSQRYQASIFDGVFDPPGC